MIKQKVNLAGFIASQREKMGSISQVELAKKCGVPAGTIASIESGYAKSPRPVTLKKLAEGLGVPTEIIFKLASNPEKEMVIDQEHINTVTIDYLGEIPTMDTIKPGSNVKEQLPFPGSFIDDGDFILTISGDSLTDEDIFDGDHIVIKIQDYLKRSGDLMLCTVEGKTTLRRVYKNDDNLKIKEQNYSKEDITFIGKAHLGISKQKL